MLYRNFTIISLFILGTTLLVVSMINELESRNRSHPLFYNTALLHHSDLAANLVPALSDHYHSDHRL